MWRVTPSHRRGNSMGRPYTPDMLADRWGCSAETVRAMIRNGELPAFRVGRMMRVTQQTVEDYECGSANSMESMSSHGRKMTASAADTGSKQKPSRAQRRKAETFFDGKPPAHPVI
ncbi:helix-turn-helix domain-containing protein [Paracoccus homiensis]|uniref:helix-turn-helix domain-containing protein n=1 Tax=Paracoccus homiensis TaxID=364199 RepID=UPI000B8904B2